MGLGEKSEKKGKKQKDKCTQFYYKYNVKYFYLYITYCKFLILRNT